MIVEDPINTHINVSRNATDSIFDFIMYEFNLALNLLKDENGRNFNSNGNGVNLNNVESINVNSNVSVWDRLTQKLFRAPVSAKKARNSKHGKQASKWTPKPNMNENNNNGGNNYRRSRSGGYSNAKSWRDKNSN